MGEYDIRVYTPELASQVIEVLQGLWGGDAETNRAYFQWKYLDNPHTEKPLGIVATLHKRVVGFRGYFAVRYTVPSLPYPILVLVPGDTCVHPEHRRCGLSVQMGRLAMETFAEISPLFLNMTATYNSLPGYLNLGFRPLADKEYVSAYTLPGLLAYLATYRQQAKCPKTPLQFGASEDICPSDQPRPEAMASIVARRRQTSPKIAPAQDEAFFRWRFANPRKRYRFYYAQTGKQVTGYIVLGLSPNARRGYVLDYADADGVSVEKLLHRIITQRDLDIVSIYRFCLNDLPDQAVKRLPLKGHGLLRMLERRKTGELPLLIRPVKTTYTEADWIVGGVDIREIRNWHIKEIISDAV